MGQEQKHCIGALSHNHRSSRRNRYTCKRQSPYICQSCPDVDRNGFILQDEMAENWENLDQTQILIFHSFVAEYAKVANITDNGDGRKKLLFQEPLKHDPIGTWNIPSGWRFLPFNNIALLDASLRVCLH